MTVTLYNIIADSIKNQAFTFYIPLVSQANNAIFKTTPTLAAGDITISIDGGNFANITTLPTQIQSTGMLPVVLTAAEMNGDIIIVEFHDVAGAEWQDAMAEIRTKVAVSVGTSDAADVSANVTAIKAKTDNLPSDPADESLLQAAIAAAVATLLAAITSGGVTAEEVWEYTIRTLTQAAAAVAATVSGEEIVIVRGDTMSISLTGLGSLAGRTKLWFTVKHGPSDIDAESIIQIVETTGLVYFNGASAATPADGSLVVNDENAGDVTITLIAARVAELGLINGKYDIQVLDTGVVSTKTLGSFRVSGDVTRSVS